MALTRPLDGTPDLPVAGPGSLAALKQHLRIAAEDVDDDDQLDVIVAAVQSTVRRWPVAADARGAVEDTPGEAWPEAVEYGATLLGARLYRRRNSPAGVETFGQLGAVYVMRNDPDVAMLLKLGPYARPAVG